MRRIIRCGSSFITGLACSLLLNASSALADPAPYADLWQPPALSHVSLSPDGRYIAAIQEDEREVRNVVLIDLQNDRIKRLPGSEKLSFSDVAWIDAERVLATCLTGNSLALYVIPRDDPAKRHAPFGHSGMRIVGYPESHPGHALVSYHESSPYHTVVVREIDLSEELDERFLWQKSEALPPLRIYPALDPDDPRAPIQYHSNWAGELAWAMTGEWEDRRFHRYDPTTETWADVALTPGENWVFSAENDLTHWWVASDDQDRSLIGRFNAATGVFDAPTWTDETYDLSRAVLFQSPNNHEVVGYGMHRKRFEYTWLAEDYALAHQAVAQQHPELDHRLISVSDDRRRYLFHAYNGATRGSLMLVDLEKRSINTIAELSPQLDRHGLKVPQAVTFRTRDGIPLDGYLTMPTTRETDRKPPLVVLGSNEPVSWHYNAWVHYFSSRGCAVLQVDDRTVSNRHLAHREDIVLSQKIAAADRVDAIRAIAGSGLIDATRIATFGAGWSGYQAMLVSSEAPDLIHCSIALNAIYDLEHLYRRARRYVRLSEINESRKRLTEQNGTQDLDELSPAGLAEHFDAPVFVAGPKVAIASASFQQASFVRTLRRRGVPVESFVGRMENGWFKPAEEREFYRALENFLEAHLTN